MVKLCATSGETPRLEWAKRRIKDRRNSNDSATSNGMYTGSGLLRAGDPMQLIKDWLAVLGMFGVLLMYGAVITWVFWGSIMFKIIFRC